MNKNFVLRVVVALAVLIVALVQWLVIMERVSAAMWDWYKFHGYGGAGVITVGSSSQALFYVLACIGAALGFWAARGIDDSTPTSSAVRRASKAGAIALLAGMGIWSMTLLSPLVTFRCEVIIINRGQAEVGWV